MEEAGNMEKRVLVHGLAALLLASIILAWGVLLSPPLKDLRGMLGIPELPDTRFNGQAAEIIPEEGGSLYLARIAHYYHALFAVLLYGTIVALVAGFRPGNSDSILNLALAGSIATALGGLGYSYVSREPYLHGLFIAGLGLLFASGLLLAINAKPTGRIGLPAYVTGVLILAGGLIGGYIGSSFMDHQLREEFVEAVIDSRFNPDLAEDNVLWRAWTGHQHAMIALVMVLVFTAAAKLLSPSERMPRTLSVMLTVTTAVMAVASFMVWPIGGIAHLIITPAALFLSISTLVIAWKLPQPEKRAGRELGWTLRVGNILVWAYVIIPGAIIAMSLEKPLVYDPPIRDPSRDWMELAFNIGHWHLLLTAWGVTLLAIWNHTIDTRYSWLSTRLALIGYTVSGLGATLYYMTPSPGSYQPNPYDNVWLTTLVEPGLAMVSLAIIISLVEGVKRLGKRIIRL